MRLICTVVAACAAMALSARAQGIFVVDQQGRPGSHYTDLPEAVAAVPSGSTLRVRSGSYAIPAVVGKALSIVGEDAAGVVLSSANQTVGVSNTAPGQVVLWKDLTLRTSMSTFELRDTRGPVVFDGVVARLSGVFQGGIYALRASCVQLHGCELRAMLYTFSVVEAVDSSLYIGRCSIGPEPGAQAVASALRLTRSRCVCVDSTCTGSSGQQVEPLCYTYAGSSAVLAADSSSFVGLRSGLIGGNGGPALTCPFGGLYPGQPAGHGIEVSGGSHALIEGRAPVGGVGQGPAPGPPGQPYVLASGGTILVNAASNPSAADLVGTSARGQTVTLALSAAPNSPAALLFSLYPGQRPLEPRAPGSVLAAFTVAATLVVPSSGVFQQPFRLPLSWPLGLTVYGQFVTVEPGSGRIWATNAVPWHTSS
jgi:hypothetical protein